MQRKTSPRCKIISGCARLSEIAAVLSGWLNATKQKTAIWTSTTKKTLTIDPITYISINLGPMVGEGDFLAGIRVVPAGRKGNKVYGRSLNHGEPDSGEGILIKTNEVLEFPAESISVTMADVDRYSKPEADGYAPVANTVWTWLAIPPHEDDQTFVNYLLAAARRLDAAHAHYTRVLRFLTDPPKEKGFRAREAMFGALGEAESMCIALSRAIRMISQAQHTISAPIAVPQEISAVKDVVSAIRDAFEHIDERAVGKAHRENSVDAMSVFDQSDFFTSGVLRYAGHSLDIRGEVIPALIAGRRFIIEAATQAGLRKIVNAPIEWKFTEK